MKQNINLSKIDKCSGLSKKEFFHTYVINSLPVIITDKAAWTFTPEYFKSNYSHLTKTIDGKTYTFSQIIDLCKSSTPENKAPCTNHL